MGRRVRVGTGSDRDSWYRKDPEGFTKSMGYIFDLLAPPVEPVMLKAAHEQWSNRIEFFDRPIVPRAEEDLPPQEQYNEYTSEVAKWVAKHMPNTTVAGIPVNSPRRIDAAIRSLGGGVAGDISHLLDTRTREFTPSDIPVVGRAIKPGGIASTSSKSIDKFFEELGKAKQLEASKEHTETQDEKFKRLKLEQAGKAIKILREISAKASREKKVEIIGMMKDIARRAVGEDVTIDRQKIEEVTVDETKKLRERLKTAKTPEERKEIVEKMRQLRKAAAPSRR
jgi:hypothetical protein